MIGGLRLKQGSRTEWNGTTRDTVLVGLQAIGKVAGQAARLTSIDLSGCGLGAAGLTALAHSADWAEAALRVLDLSGNLISGTRVQGQKENRNVTLDIELHGLLQLAERLLAASSMLEHLDLSECQLGPSAVATLVAAVDWPGCRLLSLNILKNPIEHGGMAALLGAVQVRVSHQRMPAAYRFALPPSATAFDRGSAVCRRQEAVR